MNKRFALYCLTMNRNFLFNLLKERVAPIYHGTMLNKELVFMGYQKDNVVLNIKCSEHNNATCNIYELDEKQEEKLDEFLKLYDKINVEVSVNLRRTIEAISYKLKKYVTIDGHKKQARFNFPDGEYLDRVKYVHNNGNYNNLIIMSILERTRLLKEARAKYE